MQATPSEPGSGDYRHRLRIWFSPRVLPWIAVAALVIVFILTFFSWDGYYPGSIPVATQNAWQAAFGSASYAANGLLIVFILLFLIALLAAALAAALEILPIRLPAALERFRPWRWAIVSGITLLAFLFFILQLLSGMSLVNRIRDDFSKTAAAENAVLKAVQIHVHSLDELAKAAGLTADKEAQAEAALHASAARYTCSLWCSFWLTLVAVICAALTYFLSRRTNRPLPRIELLW